MASLLDYAAGLCLRLSLRLDPVRHAADAARRRAGSARHRLRQYRRDQRACAPAARGWPRATLLGDMLKGTVAVLVAGYIFGRDCAIVAAARRVPRPPVSGLAEVSRRQGRGDLYRASARACLASGGVSFARSGSRSRRLRATRRSPRWSRARRRRFFCGGRRRARRAGIFGAVGPAVDHAPRQHRAALAWDGR